MTVKVECDCGQRYSFDIEPVGGRMPSSVACPACGADGTAKANEILAGTASPVTTGVKLSPSPIPVPLLQERTAPTPRKLDFKQALLSLVWALIFFLGTAILLFVGWRGYFAVAGAPKEPPILLGASMLLGPLLLAIVGAVLGVRGSLHWNKKVIFSIVAGIVGLAGVYVAERFLDVRLHGDSAAVPRSLAQIARQMNANVPRELGGGIRLDGTFAGPGNRFAYRLTLLIVSRADWADFAAYMKPALVEAYKTHPDMEALRKEQVELRYQYRDKDGNQLGTIIISPKDF